MSAKWTEDVRHTMGGSHSEAKPKKELDHIRTSKAKSGGYVHEHHHTRPDHHPTETHVSADDKAMLAHMQASMGTGAPADGDPSEAGAAPDPNAAAAGAASPAGAAASGPVAQ